MKKNIKTFVCCFMLLCSCNKKEEMLSQSNLDTNKPKLDGVDTWLRDEFAVPYNIEVLYRWDENKTDLYRYLYPPKTERVRPVMEVIKAVWLESYNKVGGADFVKKIAPRELLLIGGINKNPSGTITLGLADNGRRIAFFNVDLVDLKTRATLARFLKTVQHEYAHILNQTVPFDEDAYRRITPTGRVAQWYNESTADSRELGYITNYARTNEGEDFAEMVSVMLSYDKTNYDRIINAISSSTGKSKLREKEEFVVEYFKRSFEIDFYELQKVTAENLEKMLK